MQFRPMVVSTAEGPKRCGVPFLFQKHFKFLVMSKPMDPWSLGAYLCSHSIKVKVFMAETIFASSSIVRLVCLVL